MNKLGAGRFRAFSAGSHPKSAPNPFALEQVEKLGFNRTDFKSKSWDDFAKADAPVMDIIITVCDDAAGEVCPVWPGHPATAHWGFADPSRTEGDDHAKRHAFEQTLIAIQHRIELLINLPQDKLEHLSLPHTLKQIHADSTSAR